MKIYVYIDAEGLTDYPLLIGELSVESLRGKEVFSFRANENWISNKTFSFLDPDLQNLYGQQFLPEGKINFGMFLDSSPDRWGRMLMKRRERIRAKLCGNQPKTLMESDYLLGVFDGNRMGALRFKTEPDGKFLDNDSLMATPPVTSLRTLEQASLGYESEDAEDKPEYEEWLKMLYAPGSSLGGARPKANVIDEKGNLWIAKFPSKNDDTDVGAWEFVCNQMAKQFGLRTSEFDAKCFYSKHHTFLTKRFDRNNGHRLYFASAMTLLGRNDGDHDASYLELAEFIERYGCNVEKDLHELWKRIVFNIAISNCDDHLRNHGFILNRKGWTLSPAYDLNPSAYGMGLSINIDDADNSLSFELAMQTAQYFGIDNITANQEVENIRMIRSNWRNLANNIGISRSEQNEIEIAFTRSV